MQPDIDELRNIRNSYYKNDTYKKNKKVNSENLRKRRIYNNYDYESNYYEYTNTNYHFENSNIISKINNLLEKIKTIIKEVFNKDENVIYVIIIINVMVYMTWEYALFKKEELFDNRLLNFMENHFTLSWNNLSKRKRYWTLITSMFSHKDIIHLSNNMASFHSFAIPVIRCIKKKKFFKAYMLTGICSSFAHIIFYHSAVPRLIGNVDRSIIYDFLFPQYIKNTYDNVSGLGASGAITGINTIFACLYPTWLLTYRNYFRLPAWLTMTLYILGDLYRSFTLTNGNIDTIAHVGGGVAGYIYYLNYLKPYIHR